MLAGGDANGERLVHVALEVELDPDPGVGGHEVLGRRPIEGLALGRNLLRHEVDDALVLRHARRRDKGRQNQGNGCRQGSHLLLA